MRKYVFEFKDNGRDEYDREDFKDRTRFVDYVYLNADESDCEEFAREARQFLLARGYASFTADGLVYINWNSIKFGNPEYNEEYLVTLKDNEYAICAQFVDGQWFNINGDEIDKEAIETWAELPVAVHK